MKKKATTRWTDLRLAITIILFGLSFHSKAQIGDSILPPHTQIIFIRPVFLHDTNATIKLKARLKPDSFAVKTISPKEHDRIKNMIEAKKPASFQQDYYGPDFMFMYQVANLLFSGCH